MKNFMKFLKTENGAAAAEYGLLVALIAIVIIVGVTSLGSKLNTDFTNIANKL
jgi:pilus assembly protein Flp/PilA